MRFCKCLDDTDNFTYEWVQLFRQGWFPASTDKPSTAFTFRLLEFFQELNLQGKTSLYDFWKSLERVTDNSGTCKVLVSGSAAPCLNVQLIDIVLGPLQAAFPLYASLAAPRRPQASWACP